MSSATPVTIPLLNPNEPEALISALHVAPGQRLQAGDLLCTLETTKASADLAADQDGFVAGLRLGQGQTARAGEILCYLADSPDWTPPTPDGASLTPGPSAPAEGVPDGLRITQPALALARQHGLDLASFSPGVLVTEAQVRAAVLLRAGPDFAPPESPFDPTAIVVYGGGGHGKALIELLRVLGTYHIVGVVDDGLPAGQTILDIPVVGGGESLEALYEQGERLAVNAVGGIGDVAVRIKVFQRIAQAGFACPAVAHPTAFIEASARLSPGVQVFPHAYVGSDARVGYGSIINTGAIVSHDCVLGDYTNLSPGAILAGAVQIGSGALIGMGATINLEAHIGAGARIGNGATVKSDVPERGVVRAGTIWPN
jgi:UDP-perosamine 4-acetyltransferase